MQVKVYNNLKKLEEYLTVNYDVNDSIESVIKKIDPNLNETNTNIAVGNEGFNDWKVQMSTALHFGDYLSYIDYRTNCTIVKFDGTHKFNLQLDMREKIYTIKNKISTKIHVNPLYFDLNFDGKQMQDLDALMHYSIEDNICLTLTYKPFDLTIKSNIIVTQKSRYIIENVNPMDKFESIKAKLEVLTGIKSYHLTLCNINGKILRDNSTVLTSRICSRSPLELYYRHLVPVSFEITVEDQNEQKIKVKCDHQTTIKQVKEKVGFDIAKPITPMFNNQAGRFLFLDNEKHIVDYGCDFSNCIFKYLQSQELYINMFGKNICILINPFDSIENIKLAIQKSEGIHPNQQRLIYEGKQLEEGRTVSDYGIQQHDTVDCVLRLCGGGGFDFADVTKKPRTAKWNRNAPDWRIAEPGLCLEGKCTNETCAAFNRMVIMNIGVPVCYQLDMIGQKPTICPMCKNYVKPETCGFNNCIWRFAGIKDENGQCTKKVQSDWKEAFNSYTRFDQNDKCKWLSLVIETKNYSKSITFNIKCSICLIDSFLLDIDDTNRPCKHKYHKQCFKLKYQMVVESCHECEKCI